MGTKTILVGAALVVGGVLLYKQLKPGFTAPASATPPYQGTPAPTAPPPSSQSTLDRVVNGVQQAGDLVKQGEGLFNTVKGWWS